MPWANGLLAQAAFRRFWFTRVATIMAFQMMAVGLGWQIYSLRHQAMDLGYLGLISFLPSVFLVLIIGQTADHFARSKIVLTCQLVGAALALLMAVLAATGQLNRELIFILIFILGSARAFESPTLASVLPTLVDEADLPQAISASSAAMQIAVISGPALGGLLYVLGPQVVYGTAAMLYLTAAYSLSALPRTRPTPNPQRVSLQTLLAGVRFIRHHRVVLGTLSLDLFAVLLGGATAFLPMYARDILHTGPWGLGLMRTAPAVGALIISLWLSRHPLKETGLGMFVAVAGFGIFTVIFGLSSHLWLSLMALFLAGASDMISVVIRSAMVQLETPDDMRGRVNAVNFLFIGTSNQLGEFESGVTAAWLGPIRAVVLGGMGSLLIALLWWHWFPELRKRRM